MLKTRYNYFKILVASLSILYGCNGKNHVNCIQSNFSSKDCTVSPSQPPTLSPLNNTSICENYNNFLFTKNLITNRLSNFINGRKSISNLLKLGVYATVFTENIWNSKTEASHTYFFKRFYNNESLGFMEGLDIIKTNDGGLASCGFTNIIDPPDFELQVTKYDNEGNVEWFIAWGGPEGELGTSIVETQDGSIVGTGYVSSFGNGGGDQLLIKIDLNGNFVWGKAFGGPENDQGNSIIYTEEDNFAITGSYTDSGQSDILISIFDSSGNFIWANLYGTSNLDSGEAIVQTQDGGYAIVGSIIDSFNRMIVFKTDSLGVPLWNYTLALENRKFTSTQTILETIDGNLFIFSGTQDQTFFTHNLFLSKFTSSGSFLFALIVGTSGEDIMEAVLETETDDGGIIILSRSDSFGVPSNNIMISKFNQIGEHIWSKGLNAKSNTVGNSIAETQEGDFAVTGISCATLGCTHFLAKVNNEGNLGDLGNCTLDVSLNITNITSLLILEPIDLNQTSLLDTTIDIINSSIFYPLTEDIVCFETFSPTSSPSNAPSQYPTNSPSQSPTLVPSNSPSQPPTLAPSRSPSQPPTLAPSNSPTLSPSGSPSQPPTLTPTGSPSQPPTIAPTDSPTFSPTKSPTQSPTYSPTRSPTVPPTKSPTSSPTLPPTSNPTNPTEEPTFSPTNSPTGPTLSPTSGPTESPTKSPSNAPTENDDLTAGEIVGISLGSLVGLILLILFILYMLSRIRKANTVSQSVVPLYQLNNPEK